MNHGAPKADKASRMLDAANRVLERGVGFLEARNAGQPLSPTELALANSTEAFLSSRDAAPATAKGGSSVKAYDKPEEPTQIHWNVRRVPTHGAHWERGVERLSLLPRFDQEDGPRPYEFCHHRAGSFQRRSILNPTQAGQVMGAESYAEAARAFDLFFHANGLQLGVPGPGVSFMARPEQPAIPAPAPLVQRVARDFAMGESVFLAPNGNLPSVPTPGTVVGFTSLESPSGEPEPAVMVRLVGDGVEIAGIPVNTIPVRPFEVVSQMMEWQKGCKPVHALLLDRHPFPADIEKLRGVETPLMVAFLTDNAVQDRGFLNYEDMNKLDLDFWVDDRGTECFHPLNQREIDVVSADYINPPSGIDNPSMEDLGEAFGLEIHTGPTAVFRGQKWIAPTMEVSYGKDRTNPERVSRDKARAVAEQQARYLAQRVAGINGVVIQPIEDAGAQAFLVPILVPFEWAYLHKDGEGVRDALEEILGFKN